MRRVLIGFLFLFQLALVSAQEIKDANAKKRNVGNFHGIEVGTGIRLFLSNGATEEVVVSADKTEFRDKIIAEVENGILKLHYDTKLGSVNKKNETKNLRAYVSYKQLNKLIVSTGAVVEMKNVLSTPSLELSATTGATFNGEISTTSLKIDQSTGSRVMISGKADKLEAEGSTGSKLEGEELKTMNCSVIVNTGARVTITAEKELKVKAGTGGTVKYKGNASVTEVKSNTGGTVSKI